MAETIHTWSTGSEEATIFGPFELAEGTYRLSAEPSELAPVLEKRVSYTPAKTETVTGPAYGETFSQHQVEVESAKSTWAPTGSSSFSVPAGTYRVVCQPGKGHVELHQD